MHVSPLDRRFAALVSLLGACAVAIPEWTPAPAPAGAGQDGDGCAPGKSPPLASNPLATCAKHDEVHVPDLTALGSAEGTSLRTASVRPLDNGAPMAAAAPRSCASKVGPGVATCGAAGDQDCCKVARVPGGKAGTISVAAFDLGVYEVTSGRFAAFVAATGGNLRKAAEDGKWPGWKAGYTAKLAASRAEIDAELGPKCTNRSNVRDFGALTWPSADVEAAVDSLITDANARAADIRADARADRLHQKPINCTSFWTAAAFCAWDGGRLPSPDEWAFAAMGGDENRKYPWGADLTRDKVVTDIGMKGDFTWPEDFPFSGNGMNAYHIAPPGRKAGDRARWGHQDMGGNLVEWTDAGNVELTTTVRGGSWEGHPPENTTVYGNYPNDRTYGSLGFRCAYGAAPIAAPPPPPPPALVDVRKNLDPNEPVAFRIPSTAPAGGGVALFACAGFASNDATCGGQGAGKALGFAYATAATGLLPIYRCGAISTTLPDVCARANQPIAGTTGFAIPGPPSAWLRGVYQAALARDVDVVGHEGWLTLVDRGGCGTATLGQVTRGVLLSPELAARGLSNEAKVEALYRAGLSRAPDAQGGPAAALHLASGLPFSALVDGLVGSPEFASLSAARCSL